ncbi:hypothetical protein H8356DRAFT_1369857 [Neocallimastix lanati (nom. inval.)]|nr:hypothetical protein H8356DRAFT_1369857 [Neocallimastix sp. JGI-2020a]
MQVILNRGENFTIPLTVDIYQTIYCNSFFTNQYFVWVCLLLLVNKGNWKRPVIIVLILHWLFRSMGDFITNHRDLLPRKFNQWPYSNEGWTIPFGVAGIFWYSSEIIGDWYPLLRTKAIVSNSKKIVMIYVICIFYNLVKVAQFFNNITFIPFKEVNGEPSDISYFQDFGTHAIRQWGIVILQLIVSFIYDLAVIRTFKTQIFNKIKNDMLKKNTFITNFKFISEYRIKFSMMATIVSFPFIFGFSFLCVSQMINRRKGEIPMESAEIIRQCVLNINYTLMYIDQILLRFFVDRNNRSKDQYINPSPLSFGHYRLKFNPSSNTSSQYETASNATKHHKYFELEKIISNSDSTSYSKSTLFNDNYSNTYSNNYSNSRYSEKIPMTKNNNYYYLNS